MKIYLIGLATNTSSNNQTEFLRMQLEIQSNHEITKKKQKTKKKQQQQQQHSHDFPRLPVQFLIIPVILLTLWLCGHPNVGVSSYTVPKHLS